jgi:hypothetical protein
MRLRVKVQPKRDREEIDRFLAKLEGAAASGVSAAPSGLIG